MFNQISCKPLFNTEKQQQSAKPETHKIRLNHKPSKEINSYNLNLLTRIHDFQRVIHETKLKTAYLKTNISAKFDASSRLRQLQVKREQKLQQIGLYKEQLSRFNSSIRQLQDFNSRLSESTQKRADKLNKLKEKSDMDRERHLLLDRNIQISLKELNLSMSKLKIRQKQLINQLAQIFQIEEVQDTPTNLVKRYRILNIYSRLPSNDYLAQGYYLNSGNNSVLNTSIDKENSVILGFIAQCLQLLSNFLNLPLRYPIVFKSSKSIIIEQFNESDYREYALYKINSASHSDELFLHSISLLNLNLLQIRILFDTYKNIDQNDLIGNLKWILDHFKQ